MIPNQEPTKILDDTFNFDGYQVVRGEFFAHTFEPSITFNNNRLYVNMACLNKLPTVEYVQILINQLTRKLVLRPCREDEKDSFRWCSSTVKRKPKQITCRVFFAKLAELMHWNCSYRYKLMGKLISANQELLFVFDLSSTEVYPRKVSESGKICTARQPIYPEEWKNQFGLPVAEHQKQLQINIFNGFTVFGIKDDSSIPEIQQPIKEEVEL